MEIGFGMETAQPLQNVHGTYVTVRVRRKAHGLGNGAKAPLYRYDPNVYGTSVRSFVVTTENIKHTQHTHLKAY